MFLIGRDLDGRLIIVFSYIRPNVRRTSLFSFLFGQDLSQVFGVFVFLNIKFDYFYFRLQLIK